MPPSIIFTLLYFSPALFHLPPFLSLLSSNLPSLFSPFSFNHLTLASLYPLSILSSCTISPPLFLISDSVHLFILLSIHHTTQFPSSSLIYFLTPLSCFCFLTLFSSESSLYVTACDFLTVSKSTHFQMFLGRCDFWSRHFNFLF